MTIKYFTEVKQEVSDIIFASFTLHAKNKLFLDEVVQCLFSSIVSELHMYCLKNSFKETLHCRTTDTLTIELTINYGSIFILCATRQQKLFCTMYSTIDDLQILLFNIQTSFIVSPEVKTWELQQLYDRVSFLEKENYSLKNKLNKCSDERLKQALLDVINELDSISCNKNN